MFRFVHRQDFFEIESPEAPFPGIRAGLLATLWIGLQALVLRWSYLLVEWLRDSRPDPEVLLAELSRGSGWVAEGATSVALDHAPYLLGLLLACTLSITLDRWLLGPLYRSLLARNRRRDFLAFLRERREALARRLGPGEELRGAVDADEQELVLGTGYVGLVLVIGPALLVLGLVTLFGLFEHPSAEVWPLLTLLGLLAIGSWGVLAGLARFPWGRPLTILVYGLALLWMATLAWYEPRSREGLLRFLPWIMVHLVGTLALTTRHHPRRFLVWSDTRVHFLEQCRDRLRDFHPPLSPEGIRRSPGPLGDRWAFEPGEGPAFVVATVGGSEEDLETLPGKPLGGEGVPPMLASRSLLPLGCGLLGALLLLSLWGRENEIRALERTLEWRSQHLRPEGSPPDPTPEQYLLLGQAATQRYPHHPRLHLELGRDLLRAGRLPEARASLLRARDLLPAPWPLDRFPMRYPNEPEVLDELLRRVAALEALPGPLPRGWWGPRGAGLPAFRRALATWLAESFQWNRWNQGWIWALHNPEPILTHLQRSLEVEESPATRLMPPILSLMTPGSVPSSSLLTAQDQLAPLLADPVWGELARQLRGLGPDLRDRAFQSFRDEGEKPLPRDLVACLRRLDRTLEFRAEEKHFLGLSNPAASPESLLALFDHFRGAHAPTVRREVPLDWGEILDGPASERRLLAQ